MDRQRTPRSKGEPSISEPYWGSGFYTKTTAAFLLDAGIVTWSDFKEAFDASAHGPMSSASDIFKLEWDLLMGVGDSLLVEHF